MNSQLFPAVRMWTAKCDDSAPVVAMMLCVLVDMAVKLSTTIDVETGWLTDGCDSNIVQVGIATGDNSDGGWYFNQRCSRPFWRNGYSNRGLCRTGTCLSGRGTHGGNGNSKVDLMATWRCCCVATTCWNLSCLAKGYC
jgi:hypothetical protein